MTADGSRAPEQRPGPPEGFREALTPNRWVLLALAGLVLSFAVVAVPFGLPAALGTLLAAGAGLGVLTWWSTPLVAVRDGELLAGRAHVPVELLGRAEVLERDALRRAVGPSLDARAYLCIRGWLPRAVRVELVDPDDPTPYWIVSSRRPEQLLDALARAREGARGAPS